MKGRVAYSPVDTKVRRRSADVSRKNGKMWRIRKDKGKENGLASHISLGAVHNSSKCLPRMASIRGEINVDVTRTA